MRMDIAGLKVERASPRVPEDRPPILVIHGMWGGAWTWDNSLGVVAGRGDPCYAWLPRVDNPVAREAE